MSNLVVNDSLTIPASELTIGFARASGPGGQHVNRTETKVELRWNLRDSQSIREHDRTWLLGRLANQLTSDGELIVTASSERSQSRNRADARRKLAALIRDGLLRPKRRRATRPSRGSVERRLAEKRRRGSIKQSRRGDGDE